MLRLLFIFWGICRGQKTPQDLPYSIRLFWILVFFAIILDVINLQVVNRSIEPGWAVITIVSQTIIYYSVLAVFMYLMGFSRRINQTVNSLLGSGLITGLLATPLLLLVGENSETPGLPVLLFLALLVWVLLIISHILRHALSISLPIAFILSIGFFMLNILMDSWFLPDLVVEVVPGGS